MEKDCSKDIPELFYQGTENINNNNMELLQTFTPPILFHDKTG